MKLLLLMTATIDPQGMPGTVRTDPISRCQDYLQTLKRWIAHSDGLSELVFCENSMYPLGVLQELAKEASGRLAIRFLQFNGNHFARERGKSYGEAKILEYTLNNLPDLADYDYLIKCTGRVYIPHWLRLLKCLAETPAIVSEMPRIRGSQVWVESRFFAGTPSFFRNMVDAMVGLEDGWNNQLFENVLAQQIGVAISEGKKWRPFSELPYYIGISGGLGRRMNHLGHFLEYLGKNHRYHRIVKEQQQAGFSGFSFEPSSDPVVVRGFSLKQKELNQ